MPHKCIECGTDECHSTNKYCSPKCSRVASNKRHRAYLKRRTALLKLRDAWGPGGFSCAIAGMYEGFPMGDFLRWLRRHDRALHDEITAIGRSA